MSGRGKSRKGQQGGRGGGGERGRGQPTNPPASTTSSPRAPNSTVNSPQQFVAAPAPTGAAWGPALGGKPTPKQFVPAPAPTATAWGPPPSGKSASQQFISAPAPTASAWAQPSNQPVQSQSTGATRKTLQSQPQPVQPHTQSAWSQPQAASSSRGNEGVSSQFSQHSSPSTSRGNVRGQPVTTPQPTQGPGTRQNKPQQQPTREQPQRGANEVNRGGKRERVQLPDIIRTKPADMNSKCGTSGARVPLLTNYYKLTEKPNWQLYQYRVDFSPEVFEAKGKWLIKQKKDLFGGYLFDGTMLFLTVKLQNDVTEFMSKDREGNPIQTKVKFIKLLSMTTGQSLQVLNLIQRKSMKALDLQLVGRNFFDPVAKVSVHNNRLQLWPGYITSIRQHERDILLCAEITTKVMRSQTVLDILKDCYRNNSEEYKILFQNEVIGMTVYTPYNNKSYRIDDVDWDQNPTSLFLYKKNEMSFVDYYKVKHELIIKDKGQPMLISKASARDLRGGEAMLLSLVPEFCQPTGLNEDMRRNFKLTREISEYTRLAPAARLHRLRAFNHRLQITPGSIENFREWNFALDRNLLEVTGRCLPNERIIFGNNKQIPTNPTADWSRDFRNVQMYNSQYLTNWVIIYYQLNKPSVDTFLQQMHRAAAGMSYRMNQATHISMDNESTQTYSRTLDQAAKLNPQLIMCIVPNQDSYKYSIIKKKCCLERAIPTQVMLLRTIQPKPGKDPGSLMTVGTKVVIQMNSKLGGAPWMVDIPLGGLMVIGFDVYHDTINKKESYGAMVATMDMKLKQNYFSAISRHTSGAELSNQFALNIMKAIDVFRKQHGEPPKKILIYRDGVGEGQTNYVYEHEIKVIQAALKTAYKGAPVAMTFVVVSKRINTRFFKDPHHPQNPSPGTVVDDAVTLPERYDFFLVSQAVNQGTVSPTNYNVLHDGIQLQPDKLQILTYKMTHLYYNWTGTLRVPAVCQYAHKLAFLVGNYLHESPSHLLEKQLYFL